MRPRPSRAEAAGRRSQRRAVPGGRRGAGRRSRTGARAAAGLAGLLLAAGCAVTRIDANVNTTGQWPPGREPGRYAFQRLPSQQADREAQARTEAEAKPAVEAAGFVPAASGAAPDVWVQVAARAIQVPTPVFDPWIGAPGPWGPGNVWVGGWRGAGWGGWGWGGGWAYGVAYTTVNEASVLIVDARTGASLYESRALTDAPVADAVARQALFAAALRDFPYPAVSPRRVTIDLAPAAAAASAPPGAAASVPGR
jgi:hypothetical protein